LDRHRRVKKNNHSIQSVADMVFCGIKPVVLRITAPAGYAALTPGRSRIFS
jgi:hypothetical protein